MRHFWVQPLAVLSLLLAGAAPSPAPVAASGSASPTPPPKETLSYSVTWRLIHAGNARLTWSASDVNSGRGWQAELYLESAGLVSKLFKVHDEYSSVHDAGPCVQRSLLKVHEGNRRREAAATFDPHLRKARYIERDLVSNQIVTSNEIDIAECEHDVVGALYKLRGMRVELGQSVEIPVSDGKKAVLARVQAEGRETIKTDSGTYATIRYEAFLFNNVLYRRRGRLFVWLTDDERRLPVQIRIRLPFYIGNVTLQLEKEGKV